MDKQPNSVSVLILTLDEEKNIRRCLESVAWADEVFILDSGSTDATPEIARRYTDKVFTRKFDDWSSHLNWALENLPLKNEWLLNVDADEVVTDGLAREIIAAARRDDPGTTAWWVRRRFIFLGKWLRHGGLYDTWILRMFRRRKVRFTRLVNPVPVYEGGDGYFESDLLHDDGKGFSALVARHNSYSTLEAMEMLAAGDRSAPRGRAAVSARRRRAFERLPLVLRPPARFVHMYLIRLGFLDGLPGFIYSFFKLCYEFFIAVKVYELRLEKRKGRA